MDNPGIHEAESGTPDLSARNLPCRALAREEAPAGASLGEEEPAGAGSSGHRTSDAISDDEHPAVIIDNASASGVHQY